MKTTLRIDRLVLRTRGLAPASARAAANALGPALAESIGTQAAAGKVSLLNVTVPASAANSPAEIARHVASQLSSAPRS